MKRLLIVEDDSIMRKFYSVIFLRNGFESYITDDGDNVMEYLKTHYVDLIILDINLSNTYLNGKQINGLALLSIIKQIKSLERIPIVLVTAHSFPQDKAVPLINNSAEIWVTKPIVSYSEFVNKINKLIAK